MHDTNTSYVTILTIRITIIIILYSPIIHNNIIYYTNLYKYNFNNIMLSYFIRNTLLIKFILTNIDLSKC